MSKDTPEIRTRIARSIASDIAARTEQVVAAIDLLDGGATVPFIARYRKEVTGGLDDTQLRTLEDRLTYLRDMEARRAAIIASITEQEKMTPELLRKLAGAETKAVLEDIYLPFKPKRRTRAQIARENGLTPLIEAIRANLSADPKVLAQSYLGENVADVKAALEGARDILAEELSENADLLGRLRGHMRSEGEIRASVIAGKEVEGAKFSDYFAHNEPLKSVAGHRALAMFRARKEGILSFDLVVDPEALPGQSRAEGMVKAVLGVGAGTGAGEKWLADAAGWTWRVKLSTGVVIDLLGELRERAEEEAIQVFARNLKDLLLAAPAGNKAVMGLDPGIRTGVKVAIVDATGKLLATETVYPFQPKNDLKGAQATLATLIKQHGVQLIAIGNGTASRETERLVSDLLAMLPGEKPAKIVVSEAGASVYSASALAAQEFPQLDVSLRGAVSIARRLQDPLAELVKIDPKSIGVGQYQHDVNEFRLNRALDGVVEDAVNAVGVDLNTASAPLLARVAGIGTGLAEGIVAHRDLNGPFQSRKDLLKVARLGPKAFEQCAGFLRIRDGKEPLDASSVHPEAYDVARKIVASCGRDLRSLTPQALRAVEPERFTDDRFGLPTVKDILLELEKPGRDPRPEFKTATFTDGVEEIKDLKVGMLLEGVVTNVAAFGAFVDIGVHQDGLVHVSQLADKFVKDPHEIVKAGQVVKVRVTEVDVPRKRIALSMKRESAAPEPRMAPKDRPAPKRAMSASPQTQSQTGGFGSALLEAMRKK